MSVSQQYNLTSLLDSAAEVLPIRMVYGLVSSYDPQHIRYVGILMRPSRLGLPRDMWKPLLISTHNAPQPVRMWVHKEHTLKRQVHLVPLALCESDEALEQGWIAWTIRCLVGGHKLVNEDWTKFKDIPRTRLSTSPIHLSDAVHHIFVTEEGRARHGLGVQKKPPSPAKVSMTEPRDFRPGWHKQHVEKQQPNPLCNQCLGICSEDKVKEKV